MEPSFVRITSCDPSLAQASAQSRLIGLSSPFVNAQAESRTYPSTMAGFCGLANVKMAKTPTTAATAPTIFRILIGPPNSADYFGALPGCQSNKSITWPQTPDLR